MRMEAQQRSAATHFRSAFGGVPDDVWSAPGRINLIGEHTDYNAGLCLPFAVGFRAECAVRRNRSGRVRIVSAQKPGERLDIGLDSLLPGAVTGWAAYVAGSVWVSATEHEGLDIVVDSDIPEGAGLSSSAALECATLGALGMPPGMGLALAAQRAENDFVGVPCGLMDQAASVLSTTGHALRFDARALSCQEVALDLGEAALLVLDTLAPHQLDDGAYALRRRECADAARELGVATLRDATTWDGLPSLLERRARHVITENARVELAVQSLTEGTIEHLGLVMTASHLSLRDDFQVTVPQLDLAVEAALDGGAIGARMTGGGFGGSIIALVHDVAEVAIAVEQAFARQGWTEPRWMVAEPQAGLTRVP